MARDTFPQQCWLAAQRGATYLLAQQSTGGQIGSGFILDYYKAPWALAAAGYPQSAWRLLDWIRDHIQTQPGQFHCGDDLPELLRSSTYRNVIIMIGAMLLGRFDIVNDAAIENLKSYQHPTIGAFYGEQRYHTGVDLNTNHTGMAGLLCLYAGLIEEAKRAGDYILAHLADQPAPDQIFYINTDVHGQLIIDCTQDERIWRVVDYTQPQGHFWAMGTGAVFLASLFARTGDAKYIDAAKTLVRLSYRLAPGFSAWPSSGKIAWGAARIYAFTREEEFRVLAQQIAQKCFLDSQSNDGSWGPFFLHMGGDGRGYELPVLELTAEFTLLTTELARCLSC